jgi:hypothetical protein
MGSYSLRESGDAQLTLNAFGEPRVFGETAGEGELGIDFDVADVEGLDLADGA